MIAKRLTLELPVELYEFLSRRAVETGGTISGILRGLIEEDRRRGGGEVSRDAGNDPFAVRRGSFKGPVRLSEDHDKELYGGRG